MVYPGIIAGLFGITIFAAVVTGSASAEYNWSNHITVHPDGMEWQYTEKLSGVDSYVFKYNIDNKQGNNDKFVSTWELMKGDKWMRGKFSEAIERETDVRIDNSSQGIVVLDIDASLSNNALGNVESMTELTNTYIVTYSFQEGILENGSTIWFLGEPGTQLSVVFPEGTKITSTKGIDNVSIMASNLSGRFGGAIELINTTESKDATHSLYDNISVIDNESANENISVIDNKSANKNISTIDIEAANENTSLNDNESDGAEGAEITYAINKTYIMNKVHPTQDNMSTEPKEKESAIPIPTEIPFPGIVFVLLLIATAVILSKD